jgi:acyl transferase domain-containing protein/acyl carrier protein/NADP-dependent 3-hydroxy acid dehydrogenase YdfG
MKVRVHISENSVSKIEESRATVDIDLCDAQGNIIIAFKGVSFKKLLVDSKSIQPIFNPNAYTPAQNIGQPQTGITLAVTQDAFTPALSIATKPSAVQLTNLQSIAEISDRVGTIPKPQVTALTTLTGVVNLTRSEPLAKTTTTFTTTSVEPIVAASGNTKSPSARVTVLSRDKLQQQLKLSLAEALYMSSSDIELDRSFVDLGLDSIVGVEWVKVINKQYGLEISATRVYDYSNIKELAAFLEKEIEKLPQTIVDADVPPAVELIVESIVEQVVHSRTLADELQIVTTSSAAAPIDISQNNALKNNVEPTRASPLNTEQVPAKKAGQTFSQDQLQQQLRSSLADALYMQVSDIDNDKSFVDLGLDSIVGVEWVKAINKQYGLEISATRVYDYSNIKQLSAFLKQEIEKLPASETAQYAVSEIPLKEGVYQSKIETPEVIHQTATSQVVAQTPVFSANSFYPTLTRKIYSSKTYQHNGFISATPAADANLESSFEKNVETNNKSNPSEDKVAIIGMSGRYPQANNLEQYWENLTQGKNSIVEIPSSRWDVNQYYDSNPAKPNKVYSKWLGMLDDVDCFDPLFFQISPAEAEKMDPQHRIFMEESYKAFEDAGYSNQRLSNVKCGVYLGIMSSEYTLLLAKSNSSTVDTTGNSYAIGAARIAYYLNLKGPAIPIDTACSSSLVAIHLACQGLLNGEINLALAGGVSLYLIPETYLGMCQAGMLSPQGQCKTFDDTANGFVPGEGVGAVVLKRLSDAEADKDHIYGVILGSGINQDGKTNGITAPSVNSQIELERDIYTKYDINPESITYIETHGTGTKLGDPIELEALSTVFKEKTSKKNYCALGAVKSNIGHVSGAAGVASVQKVLLSMRHKTLVPSLNVVKENTFFDFKNSPFYITREKQVWLPASGSLRRAGVSSFGFSGTNSHLVIEEYLAPIGSQALSSSTPETSFGVILSARTEAQLQQKARDLLAFIQSKQQTANAIDLTSLSYTLQMGREAMKERLGMVVASLDEVIEKLTAYIAGTKEIDGLVKGHLSRDSEAMSMFTADADLKDTLEKWYERKEYSKLLNLWVKGVDLEWSKVYQGEKISSMSLPTYPFAKERYWVDLSAISPSVVIPSIVTNTNNAIHVKRQAPVVVEEKVNVQYRPQWKIQSLASQQSTLNWPVMIVGASVELLSALKNQLISMTDSTIIVVHYGESFKEVDQNVYAINPVNIEDYQQLIDSLAEKDVLPGEIIFLDTKTSEVPSIAEDFYHLFYSSQSLLVKKHFALLKILFVFTSDYLANQPAKSAIGGFLKSLNQENPKYIGKAVEIENPNSELTPVGQATLILAELADSHWKHVDVRYALKASGTRTLTEKVQLPAENAIAVPEQPYARFVKEFIEHQPEVTSLDELPLKHKGVYVITGGLGGLGLIFSEYLLKHFSACLVLSGRSPLNDEQQKKLDHLASFGGKLVYVQADVSIAVEAEKIIAKAKDTYSGINGIIHSAGVNRDSFIIKKTSDEISQVFNPKILGAVNLDNLTAQDKLDFFVLFSSGAGAMGSAGQSDYAYANHFLDGFAEQREGLVKSQRRFGKTLSINWPYWTDGGMALSSQILSATELRTGMCALVTEDGIKHFEQLLVSDCYQALALHGSPSKIAAFLKNEEPQETISSHTPLTNKAHTEDLLEKTERYVKGLISDIIKLAPDLIDSQERLETFGIDSIMINKFNANLERDLGSLPKTLLYEYETIEELAHYLCQETSQELLAFFDIAEDNIDIETRCGHSQIQNTTYDVADIAQTLGTHSNADTIDQIAIIGVHGIYPQSADLDEYWENLKNGKDLIDEVPATRWDIDEFYDANPEKASDGKIYCKWGGFLTDFDKFDPQFFNITPQEAKIIDPQERLFLQSVWSAIEDAGYTRESLKRKYPKAKSADVGVFVGVTTNSYHLLATEEWSRGNMVTPGALPWSIANRVSYFFDFQGPSMPVDTACSSSLVAIHLACESLKQRECQVAIAGGVNLYLHPAKYQSFCQRRMVSVGGKNCSFGAGDDGFVPGEGVGTLVLKPLSKAIEDEDHVYAVIAASAFDHSGRSNGYSAPNPNSQANLISQTLQKANIHPESIGYVEGHGTGTQLGDSLEIVSLTQAFQQHTHKKQFCPIGSVKANIGHAESAAGIAGIAKILLQFKHQQLVPTIYSDSVNPNIEFTNSPFYLQHDLVPWPAQTEQPRRALINSFGAGGVNACLVLEEFANAVTLQKPRSDVPQLIVLSAKTEDRLKEQVSRLHKYLGSNTDIDLANVAYSLQVGREAMPERLAIIAADITALTSECDRWLTGGDSNNVLRGTADSRKPGKKDAKRSEDALSASLLAAKNLNAIADLWVTGREFNWIDLYDEQKPVRITMPTYPFSKTRYWVSDSLISEKRVVKPQGINQLHPLVSYNSSTLKEVSFCSALSDTAFYAREHQVNGEKIFPGAGFLEIACIAGNIAGEQRVQKIKDIVWIQPLLFNNSTQLVKTYLKPIGNGTEFEIISLDDDNERVVHSEGRLILKDEHLPELLPPRSIQSLKDGCTEQKEGQHYYEIFKQLGFDYGAGFQPIEHVYLSTQYALAKLTIADHLKYDFDQYVLHPSVLDGALQTVACLSMTGDTSSPYLPFALDEVDIIRPLTQTCYVMAEVPNTNQKIQGGIKKFNIQILSEAGEILIQLKDFYVRALITTDTRTKESNERKVNSH